MTNINSPITELKGVGPSAGQLFNRLGIFTVKDLLLTLPFRAEDRSLVIPIKEVRVGAPCTIIGRITSVGARKSKRNVLMISATMEDDTGKIPALWFNQRYLLRYLKPGNKYYLYGEKKLLPSLGNPFIVKAIIDEPKLVPFYHTIKGLSQLAWQKAISQARIYENELEEIIPDKYLDVFTTKLMAVDSAHTKPTTESIMRAQSYLAEEELITLALSVSYERSNEINHTEPIAVDKEFLAKIVANFPFELTDSQRKVAWQIIQSLASGQVAKHLMYGEVGSGKTAVAQIVTAAVVKDGCQVAYLCPTTTLAGQQYRNFQKLFEPLGVKVALMTGASKDKDYATADIIIGTHAILQKDITLPKLALVIVDEQHRFGVEQRQQLTDDGKVHLMMMTATPIPRSLAQIIFGQLDISYLLDKPHHQQAIKTITFKETGRKAIEKDVCQRLERGEPGYVVCPLIVGSNNTNQLLLSERKTIETEAEYLAKTFPQSKIGIMHGRLKQDEKERVMADFMAGKIDILLSTTVIEVGIDNQNATWILIEEADRFGLSQLHQLRGRVGRGAKASVCYLYNSDTSDYGEARLKALEESDNGLELAEKDLSLRGPGELLGYEQSGLPNLHYANWNDIERVKKAFAIARKILDDGLDKYPKLEELIKDSQEKPTA